MSPTTDEAAAVEPVAEAKDREPTKYVVLKFDEEAGTWTEDGKIEGYSMTSALKEHIGDATEGTWVAVPARSWNPKTPRVETVHKVLFD